MVESVAQVFALRTGSKNESFKTNVRKWFIIVLQRRRNRLREPSTVEWRRGGAGTSVSSSGADGDAAFGAGTFCTFCGSTPEGSPAVGASAISAGCSAAAGGSQCRHCTSCGILLRLSARAAGRRMRRGRYRSRPGRPRPPRPGRRAWSPRLRGSTPRRLSSPCWRPRSQRWSVAWGSRRRCRSARAEALGRATAARAPAGRPVKCAPRVCPRLMLLAGQQLLLSAAPPQRLQLLRSSSAPSAPLPPSRSRLPLNPLCPFPLLFASFVGSFRF